MFIAPNGRGFVTQSRTSMGAYDVGVLGAGFVAGTGTYDRYQDACDAAVSAAAQQPGDVPRPFTDRARDFGLLHVNRTGTAYVTTSKDSMGAVSVFDVSGGRRELIAERDFLAHAVAVCDHVGVAA